MKRLLFILLVSLATVPTFAQCTMQEQNKHPQRKDQYSRSSAQNIKTSQAAMNTQQNQFQKPKYAAEVKPNAKKHTDKSQF